ncbi:MULTISPECIES: FAD-dependent oxidoreductase [unclassified Janthinobacterium]|uniref:FAD-dependent oxidoreductase n=1 Tax=unclassified Janthinobacterium TaxID=2610881 RepID=UPI00160ABCD2|nr:MULTISPECIES: FAD-dependent oxidoreductase [unclassified Janthinobacterium]MBB5607008.1 2-polyprenyl-6-methoxyphenol hydroxylase-like FAD-dependent oxidoreductase [Janthinobacterium sp. S3T4]MBB5612734.1 2-polyprenyl-6-methoxyphenol hydroxylase-like FAD-dependent oxidoreductase [Janthinobacterium sp. S3M3]
MNTNEQTSEQMQVIIVGAGPVGLLAAIELTLGGARVLVLERLAEPSKVMKALGIGPLGSEVLQRRGMRPAIAEVEARAFAAMQSFAQQPGAQVRGRESKFSGHFAGLPLIRKDAQREPHRRPGPVDQHSIEAMLAERVQALGIEVRRGCEVTSVVQQDDSVDVGWRSATGAGQLRCRWLIACDGGRSSIRKMAGFDFPGTPPSSTFYQAEVEIDHPEHLLPLGWNRTSTGVFSYGPSAHPQSRRLFMLDFSGTPENREAPVTQEEIESVLRRISGMDVRVKGLGSASRWTDNTRLAATYRQGRVLLAGDAAHIHTPFGGQGLSLGLVDAANLGWKLAAVLRGDMPDSLLDTYTAERRPVAQAVLANTLAQVAIMRPDPQAGAMRELIAELMQFDDVNRRIGEMMSGLSTRYDLGSTHDAVGRLIGDRPIGHVEAGVTLYDVMQDGKAVFLDASVGSAASRLVAASTQQVRCVAVDSGPSLLIRPDACIAWAAEGDSIDGLEQALRHWFAPGARAAQ